MRTIIAAFIILMTLPFVFGQEAIPNFQTARYQIFTAGQPTEEGFAKVAGQGVKTVLNVLPTNQCMANEEQLVTSKGMIYKTLPFEPTGFKKETIDQFGEMLRNSEKPMLIHCSTGNHVGGLWFAYRVLVEKASLPIALKEARRIGLKPELEDAIFSWVVGQTQVAQK